MTTDRPITLPPAWAESLLRMMLASKDRDAVSGDLLEEYRQTIVPERGAAADRWYLRQVAGHMLRQTWMWATLVATICVTRYLFDTLAPIHYTPGVVALRSVVMTWALVATFFGCGAWHAWRTGDPRAGVLLALIAATIGGYLEIAVTLVCLAISHGPETMRAIEGSGGLFEGFPGFPAQLMIASVITSSPGALLGLLAATIYGASRPKTNNA
jgi:hypothetical protein